MQHGCVVVLILFPRLFIYHTSLSKNGQFWYRNANEVNCFIWREHHRLCLIPYFEKVSIFGKLNGVLSGTPSVSWTTEIRRAPVNRSSCQFLQQIEGRWLWGYPSFCCKNIFRLLKNRLIQPIYVLHFRAEVEDLKKVAWSGVIFDPPLTQKLLLFVCILIFHYHYRRLFVIFLSRNS